VKNIAVQLGAATGTCAVAAALAIGAMTLHESQASAGLRSAPPTTEVTQTEQVDPTEPEVPDAKPQITGPAPLPPEEQGLPGN
jgi:hypothetical protein